MGVKDDDFSLDHLSAEEREAINDGNDDDEAALAAVIEEGEKPVKAVQDDEDDEVQDDVEMKSAAVPQAEDKSAPAESGETQVQFNEDTDSESDFQPVYVVPPVDKFNERMAALNTEKADAFKKMMDGELSAEDYAAVEEKYMNQRDELRAAQDRFVMAEQMKQQTAQQRWQWEVDNFKKTALKSDGVDYVKDEKMNSALDRWVKVLANDPDNADKPGEWFLQEAHTHVKQQYGVAKAETKAEVKTAPKNRLPDLKTIPPTLGRLPAADDGEAGNTEFSHLDKLDGLALERAVASMSVEKQERWLAAN